MESNNNNNNNYSPSSGFSTWHTLLHATRLYVDAHSNSYTQQPAPKKQKTSCLDGSFHICVCGKKIKCLVPFECLEFYSQLYGGPLEYCFDTYCSLDCVNATAEIRSEEAAPEIGIFHSHFESYQDQLAWTNHWEHCFSGH
jgi:hypothetical protein